MTAESDDPPALIETPPQQSRSSAPLHIKNDFAIYDFFKILQSAIKQGLTQSGEAKETIV